MTPTPPERLEQPCYRFAVISRNGTPWGGSEELWSAAAAELAESGHSVSILKANVDESQPRIRRLRELGCRILGLSQRRFLPRRLLAVMPMVSHVVTYLEQITRLWLHLRLARPHLAIVSQGGNFDGQLLASVCRRLKVPYVLIVQKAAEMYWPVDGRLVGLRLMYEQALASFFVSQHNRRLTEEQLGIHIPRASVVRNPFLVDWQPRNDWPDASRGLRLACVGRLQPAEKGQDILLRVLARDKWRRRDVSVTFFGDGPTRAALEQTAAYHGLTSVAFGGFMDDVPRIWDDHHGLILPSRCEGLPLVLVEAMMSGRVPIVTDVAGAAEVIDDDVTGFLARAATDDSVDEALERAWQRRHEWRAIGDAAARRIRELVPENPARVLADRLIELVGETAYALTPEALLQNETCACSTPASTRQAPR